MTFSEGVKKIIPTQLVLICVGLGVAVVMMQKEDIDSDDDLDLVYSDAVGVYALLNPGSGDFSISSSIRLGGLVTGWRSLSMHTVDINGDDSPE